MFSHHALYLVLFSLVVVQARPAFERRQVTSVLDVTVFETVFPSTTTPSSSSSASVTASSASTLLVSPSVTSNSTPNNLTYIENPRKNETNDVAASVINKADADSSSLHLNATAGSSDMITTVISTSIYTQSGSLTTSAGVQVITVERPQAVATIQAAQPVQPFQPIQAVQPVQPVITTVGNPIAPRPTTMVSSRPSQLASQTISRLSAAASSTTATAVALIPMTTGTDGEAAAATITASSQKTSPQLVASLILAMPGHCESTCAPFISIYAGCQSGNVTEEFPSANREDAQERCLCSQPEAARECAECGAMIKGLELYSNFIDRCEDVGLIDIASTKSLTVTDAPSATSAKSTDAVSLKTVDKAKSTAAASSSKSFGPEEICNVDGQSISNKEAYDQCVADTTAMNLSIGPDGTLNQDPAASNGTAAESTFCSDPMSRSNPCYGSICTGEWAAECYRKLEGSGVSVRVGKSTVLMAGIVIVLSLML